MKKTIAVIVSSLAIGLATVASANTETYTFTGVSASGFYPANEIDGSTLTISDGTITDFSFIATGLGLFATPADTTGITQNVTSYDSTGWSGSLDMTYFGVDIEVTGDSFTSGALGSSIQGTWTANAAPDSASTFALLGAAALGMAACRPMLRRQS
jgi:hypothetical protein